MSTVAVNADALSCEKTMLEVEWKPFNYDEPPEEGIYWVAVQTPEVDADVGPGGQIVGQYTGGVETDVAMVTIEVNRDGEVSFEPVNQWELGKVSEESTVSHYAVVNKPRPPIVV